jgi:hypothetical protein
MLIEILDVSTGEVTYSSEECPAIPKTGPWCFTWTDGAQLWIKEGKYHRLDGPAVTYPNGEQRWYKEGKYHRLDGPAVTSATGRQEWYVIGNKVASPC